MFFEFNYAFNIYNFYLFINCRHIITNTVKSELWGLGIGDWGLGIGDWGLGPIPNPQSPIPNPQSPIPIEVDIKFKYVIVLFNI